MGEKYNLLFLTPLTENFKCARQTPNPFVLFSIHCLMKSKETRVKTAMGNGHSQNVIKHLYIKSIFYSSLFYN